MNPDELNSKAAYIDFMYLKSEKLGMFMSRIMGAIESVAQKYGGNAGRISSNPHTPLYWFYEIYKDGKGKWLAVTAQHGAIILVCERAAIRTMEESLIKQGVDVKPGSKDECYVTIIADFETQDYEKFYSDNVFDIAELCLKPEQESHLRAFSLDANQRESVETLIIPEGATYIARGAFSKCPKLKEVTIPDTVTRIDQYAFADCPLLETVVLPKSLTAIEKETFAECESLRSVSIPEGVTRIGSWAFNGCLSLAEICLPRSLTNLEWFVFQRCNSLKKIELPPGQTKIEESTFCGCTKLEDVKLPDGVKSIEKHAFTKCKSLEAIHLPDSIEYIGYWAFEGCGLKEITLPQGLRTIEKGAFAGCSKLEKVDFPDGIKYISYDAFNDCNALMRNFKWPAHMKIVGPKGYKAYINRVAVEIDERVKSIFKKWPEFEVVFKLMRKNMDKHTGHYAPQGCIEPQEEQALADFVRTDFGIELPEEYIAFLHLTNGALMGGSYAGKDICMFSGNEVIERNRDRPYPGLAIGMSTHNRPLLYTPGNGGYARYFEEYCKIDARYGSLEEMLKELRRDLKSDR